jgi:ribosomal protein L23
LTKTLAGAILWTAWGYFKNNRKGKSMSKKRKGISMLDLLTEKRLAKSGKRWARLTEQAVAIDQKKKAIREDVETIFNIFIPKINVELERAGQRFFFTSNQKAGYVLDGNLLFELDPLFRNRSGVVVDEQKAAIIMAALRKTGSFKKFVKAFPAAAISVRANLH